MSETLHDNLPRLPVECDRCHRLFEFGICTLVVSEEDGSRTVLCGECIPRYLDELKERRP